MSTMQHSAQVEMRQTAMKILHLLDFDDLVQLFPTWLGRFEQMTRGKFHGALQLARSANMYAHQAEVNQAVHVRGREPEPVMIVALVQRANAASLWQGRQLDPGHIVVRGINVDADHRAARGAVNLQITFGEAQFRNAVQLELGDDPGPMGWQSIQAVPAHFSKLQQVLKHYMQEASVGQLAHVIHVNRLLEEACQRAAIEALFPKFGSNPRSGMQAASRSALVSRAEAYLRSRLTSPLTEADLAREMQVRGRTLRLAFQEKFGLGPMAYFQTLRLHAVRDVLKKHQARDVAVGDVAQQLGFYHLGRFANYYRRMFGELPSATPRK